MTTVPTITFVYDRRHVASAKHEGSVELRISFERKCRFVTTGVRLLPKQWNGRTRSVVCRLDAPELNETLDALLSKVRKIVNEMLEDGEVNLDEIPKRLKAATRRELTFVEFCQQRVAVRSYGKKQDTVERYERFMRWLTEWGVIRFFSDVTDANIIRMDKTLADTGMKNYSKWNNYHRFMNSFILDAIDDGYLRRNPYKWVNIKKDKTCGLQKYLSFEEFRRLETTVMPTKSLERIRDLFVFQTWTCLSYVDLEAFDAKKIIEKDGVEMYTGRRGKTGQEFTIVIMKGAKRILDKYNGKLPMVSNEKYNDYLKLVAQKAEIDKPITSHWARHTGATILLNEGKVDMEVIARILGHASTKQTRETYAKMLDKTVANAMVGLEKVM